MFPCQRYFSQIIIDGLKKSKIIIVCGLSLAMCNVLSWLKQMSVKHVAVYDPLFDANPHIKTFKGRRVLNRKEAFGANKVFYILTEFSEVMRKQDIKTICDMNPNNQVVTVDALREVRIEASGVCNLHCMSCQCGNYDPQIFSFQGRGFLQPELCRKILDKLILDYPDNMGVYYYIFGEPFLNQHLDVLIALAKQRKLSVCVSTNFSFQKDFQNVMRVEPDILKVSVSGYTQEIYQHHHNGGIAEYVYRNLETLYQYQQNNVSDTSVVVGYHVYKDNTGIELENVRKICQKFGFIFAPVKAIYNNPLKRMGLSPFTEQDLCFLTDYYEKPEEQLAFELNHKNARFPCRNLRDKLFLDFDGAVMLCELLHRNTIYKNYLDVTKEEILDWRTHHELCKICRGHGMHLV